MIEDLDTRAGMRERHGGDEASRSGADDDAIGSGDGRVLPSEGLAISSAASSDGRLCGRGFDPSIFGVLHEAPEALYRFIPLA
jgi:hypothetical protein